MPGFRRTPMLRLSTRSTYEKPSIGEREAPRRPYFPDRLSGLEHLSHGLVARNSCAIQSNGARQYADRSVSHGASSVDPPFEIRRPSRKLFPSPILHERSTRKPSIAERDRRRPRRSSRRTKTRRLTHRRPGIPKDDELASSREPAMDHAGEEYCIVPHSGDESPPFADCAFKCRSVGNLATHDLGPFSMRRGASSFSHRRHHPVRCRIG